MGRSERPATGMGSPERWGTQVENLCYFGQQSAEVRGQGQP